MKTTEIRKRYDPYKSEKKILSLVTHVCAVVRKRRVKKDSQCTNDYVSFKAEQEKGHFHP